MSATGNPRHDSQLHGVALCALSAGSFGAMPLFATWAYDGGFDVQSLLLFRFLMVAALFWGVLLATGRPLPSRRLLLTGLALGGFGYAVQAALYFDAITYIDTSLASLIFYVYPVLVFVAALAIGREHSSRRRWIALALASVGMLLVLLGGGGGSEVKLAGVLLALGSAATYTIYILVSDRIIGDQRPDPVALSAPIMTGAALTVGLFCLARGGAVTDATADGWLSIVAMSIGCTGIAVIAFFAGLRIVGPAVASIVSTVEPVVTVVLATIFLGDVLALRQIAGGALVLGAVVLLQWKAGSVARHEPAAEAARPPAAGALAREPA